MRKIIQHTRAANRTFFSRELLQAAPPPPTYQLNVTNTGLIDSDDTVLGFLVPPGAGENGVPLQVLFGFARIHVAAGETKQVELFPEWLEFSQVADDGQRTILAGTTP